MKVKFSVLVEIKNYNYISDPIWAAFLNSKTGDTHEKRKERNVSKPLMIGCGLLMVTMLAFSGLLFPHILYFLGTGTLLYFVFLSGILFLLSVAIMLINVPVQTFIQRHTPDEYMSRMFSIVGMITKGGMPFGELVYGIMLDKAPVHWVMSAVSVLLLLISVTFLSSLLKTSDFL